MNHHKPIQNSIQILRILVHCSGITSSRLKGVREGRHLFSAHGSGSRISAELRTRAHCCRSFFVLHCSWCSQLRRTAQARSSAAALRLVPYRAISSHFSPGAAAPNNPAAFVFHTLVRADADRDDAKQSMVWYRRHLSGWQFFIYSFKKNHGVVAGLWPTDFRWAFVQPSVFVQMLNSIAELGSVLCPIKELKQMLTKNNTNTLVLSITCNRKILRCAIMILYNVTIDNSSRLKFDLKCNSRIWNII